MLSKGVATLFLIMDLGKKMQSKNWQVIESDLTISDLFTQLETKEDTEGALLALGISPSALLLC